MPEVFLDRIAPPARQRLLELAETLQLDPGDHLIRRGEAGGDVYVIADGTLEVVDSRYRPEVVLQVIGPGDVVGDMAFLDGSPRSADVRAVTPCVCHLWRQSVLAYLLDSDADVGRAFYHALSMRLVDRHRGLASTALHAGLGRRRSTSTLRMPWISQQVQELARRSRARFAASQSRLKSDAADTEARAEVREALFELVEECSSFLSRFEDADEAEGAGSMLAEELHAWLTRSGLCKRAWELEGSSSRVSRVLAYLGRGEPSGDGAFGVALDAALFELPTFRAMVERSHRVGQVLSEVLPGRGPDVLVLSASPELTLTACWPVLAQRKARVTVVDRSRTTLADLERVFDKAHPGATLELVQYDVLRFVQGKARLGVKAPTALVVDGLLDHVPHGLTSGFVSLFTRHLEKGAFALTTSLADAPDADAVAALLGLPTIRRSQPEVERILGGRSFGAVSVSGEEVPGAAVVVRKRR